MGWTCGRTFGRLACAVVAALGLVAASVARAETVTFTAAGRVTAVRDGAAAPVAVGTPYALTFTLDLQPAPAAGSGLLAYTRRYDLIDYTVRLGDYEAAGTGQVALVHRPYGRDRVVVFGDDGEALLRLAGDSAAAILTGRVGPAAAPAAPALTASFSPAALPRIAGTFDTAAGAEGFVNQVALAPAAAPASAVPLPSAVWGGLALLGALAATKLRRRWPERAV